MVKRTTDTVSLAKRLAAQYGVSERRIYRDAKFATAVETLTATHGKEWRNWLLNGSLNQTEIVALSRLTLEEQRSAIQGGVEGIKAAVKRPRQSQTYRCLCGQKAVAQPGFQATCPICDEPFTPN